MNRHYIGITGIVREQDIDTARQCADIVRASAPRHVLMAGVLVNSKTLDWKSHDNPRYPSIGIACDLIDNLASDCWPVVHFNTHHPTRLYDELCAIATLMPAVRAIQLNVVAPDPAAVEQFVERHGMNVEIIVQVNAGSIGSEYNHISIPKYVDRYPTTRALVDMSGGRGREVDAVWAGGVLARWPRDAEACMLGVAGGLGPDCEPVVDAIAARLGHTSFSLDAESRIRDAHDQLDRGLAVGYVEAVARSFAKDWCPL